MAILYRGFLFLSVTESGQIVDRVQESPGGNALFYGPVALKHGRLSPHATGESMSKPIRRILVIDDDPDALQILTDYLRLEGYEVLSAADGASGMQLLAANELELVITDLNLPGISGMDVIDIIHKNYPQVQVIVVTGYGSMETVLEALHKGAIDYLTKPFLFEILKLSLQKAEQQLRMNQQLDQLESRGRRDLSASLLRSLPMAASLVDEEGRLLAPNPAMVSLFHLHEGTAEAFLDALPAAKRQRLQEFLHSDDRTSMILELPLAGVTQAIELSLLPVEDSGGLRLFCAESILDLEESPESSELEAVLIVSQHGTVLWGNEAAVDFLGLDPRSSEDTHVLDVLQGEAGGLIEEVFDRMPALTQCWRWRTRVRSSAGHERPVVLTLSPLLDDNRRRGAVCITLLTGGAPEQGAHYFRERAISLHVPLLVTDSKDQIIDLSLPLVKLIGASAEDWIGRPRKELLDLEIKSGNRLTGRLRSQRGDLPVICQLGPRRGAERLVYQVRRDTENTPLEESIEKQRRRLERASNMLLELSLGSEAESDQSHALRFRLEGLVGSLSAMPEVDRVLLFLGDPSRETHMISSAGFDPDDEILQQPEVLLEQLKGCLDPESRPGVRQRLPGDHPLGPGWALPVYGHENRRHGALFVGGSKEPPRQTDTLLALALEGLAFRFEEARLKSQFQRTEEKFRQLYDKARFAVFVISLEDASILEVNRAALDLTGYNEEELLGRRIWELRPADFREIARRNWIKSISSNGETRFEGIPLVRKDGKLIYVEYDSLITENEGQRVLQSFYRDVTEKQAMEFTLNQSQKLAGLGQLSAGIAHELRNPLGIMGSSLYYVDSTLEKSGSELSPQLKKHLGIIGKELDRARKIIENLLSFSRVSKVEREAVDLVDLLGITLDLVTKELLVNNIQLEKDLQPIPPIELNLDEMKQALLNIIINATQAMPDGGTLTIHAGMKGGMALLSFRDTGVGISKEDLPNVLNPFFTTKDPGKGTGLGLSLTHTIIQRSGGSLKIESEVGQGTMVSIELPARKENYVV